MPVESAPRARGVVYVGCLPNDALPRPLAEASLIARAIEKVDAFTRASKSGLPWSLYSDYGDTGAKRIAIEVAQYMAGGATINGEFFVERNSPLLGGDLLSVLREGGVTIVRPVV